MAGVFEIQPDVFDRVLMILHQEYSERSHRRLVLAVSEFFNGKSTNYNWPTIHSYITSLVFESAPKGGCMIFLFFVLVYAVARQSCIMINQNDPDNITLRADLQVEETGAELRRN